MVAASSSLFVPAGVNDAALGFDETSEPDGTEIDVEQAVVNWLEADGLFGEQVADIDPVVEPADAAVATHTPNLEVLGIGDGP